MSLWLKINIILLLVLTQSACNTKPVAPDQSEAAQVRKQAATDVSVIEVYPLPDPAVREMIRRARQYEQQGKLDWAITQTQRALELDQNSPLILQYIAELKLNKNRWGEAINLAHKSWMNGPKVGDLCARNWHTINRAAEHLQDKQWQKAALQAINQCQVKQKPRL